MSSHTSKSPTCLLSWPLVLLLAAAACDEQSLPEASCVIPTPDAGRGLDLGGPETPPDVVADAGSPDQAPASTDADSPDQAPSDADSSDAALADAALADAETADTTAACCETHFSYRTDARQVELMGHPAPLDWTAGTPMRRSGARWQATVCLPLSMEVYFKYRIDGSVWKHDATLDDVVDDSFGGLNNHLPPVAACPAGGRQVGRP
jgi:Glycogen recognition site of AMP-activated protein kinase